jgi:hypothetical protein
MCGLVIIEHLVPNANFVVNIYLGFDKTIRFLYKFSFEYSHLINLLIYG